MDGKPFTYENEVSSLYIATVCKGGGGTMSVSWTRQDKANAWPIVSDHSVLLKRDFKVQNCNCAQVVEQIFLWNSEFSKQGE